MKGKIVRPVGRMRGERMPKTCVVEIEISEICDLQIQMDRTYRCWFHTMTIVPAAITLLR